MFLLTSSLLASPAGHVVDSHLQIKAPAAQRNPHYGQTSQTAAHHSIALSLFFFVIYVMNSQPKTLLVFLFTRSTAVPLLATLLSVLGTHHNPSILPDGQIRLRIQGSVTPRLRTMPQSDIRYDHFVIVLLLRRWHPCPTVAAQGPLSSPLSPQWGGPLPGNSFPGNCYGQDQRAGMLSTI